MQRHSHRPGALKQINKSHKLEQGKTTSDKRKLFKVTGAKGGGPKVKKEMGRIQRRNHASQVRKNKREEVLEKKRKIGGLDSNPFLVCILPLHQNYDPETILNLLMQCDPQYPNIKKSPQGVTHIYIPKLKQRFSFVVPSLTDGHDWGILDTLKVCDTVLFLTSAITEEAMDEWGKNILQSAFAQGLPSPILALTDMESIPQKRKQEYKKIIEKGFSKWFSDEKLYNLEKDFEAMNILRKIGDQKMKPIHYRDRRPYMYAENVEFVPNQEGALGTLKMTGFLRGTPLSVNSLVHIPGLGDFQMLEIDSPPDPFKNANCEEKQFISVLQRCDPSKQESLESENIPAPMDEEQTWPTEEEIMMAKEEQKMKKIFKAPKGWSDYQAVWQNGEDDLDSASSDSEDEDDGMDIPYQEAEESENENEEEDEIMTQSEVPANNERYDQDMDLEAEKKALEMLKQAKTDAMFPDEVDTPMDQLAKDRFLKYKGLGSFKTSPWDPYENLPSDYQKILSVPDMKKFKPYILKKVEEEEQQVLPGWYITVHIKDVSELAWNTFKEKKLPLTFIGMFPYEHKMTVVHTVLRRTNEYALPIKSKSRLIFQCGYRRFAVCPIFSEHVYQANHKFNRFFQPNTVTVATFYAPLQFTPAPVLCYKEMNKEQMVLVATGSLLSCDTNRIILKRVALAGHPLKIHKRSAVIRFMFFNREDILYFKPVQLKTRRGNVGNIKEPLGTHGHMKCTFKGQINSQDVVFMHLYKRMFPKWNYEEHFDRCIEDKCEVDKDSSSMEIEEI